MHRHLLMTIALCCVLNAQAQLFKGGAELGLLASQVDGDNMTGYHKPGLYAALFTNLPLNEGDFQLQMGLAYMQKGCKATNSQEEGALNTYHLTLHQAGIPLTLRWNRLEPFFFEAGCSFNITPLVRIRRNGELYQLGADDDTYRFFELGGIAGLQWQLDGHWGLHLRMLYSLTPAGKSRYLQTGLRNNSLLLNLSYTF